MVVSQLLVLCKLKAEVLSATRMMCVTGLALLASVFFAQPLDSQNAIGNEHENGITSRGLPMGFEPNRGQTVSSVRFLSRGRGYEVFLTDREAVLAFESSKNSRSALTDARSTEKTITLSPDKPSNERRAADMIRIQLTGDTGSSKVQGESILPGKVNYIMSGDEKESLKEIETYERVRYAGVYPGVDLVHHGMGGQLEYDFLLRPGASPDQILMHIGGAKELHIKPDGNLLIGTRDGELNLKRPVIYQEIKGIRHSISGGFRIAKNDLVGFSLGHYDQSQPLIIDPVLAYSTYLGGGFNDAVQAIAVDQAGSAYVTGVAYSCDFPTTVGSFEPTFPTCFSGFGMLFASKLSADGSSLIYSTFLGAYGSGNAIAVDSSGNAYVGGWVGSDLPVTPGAFQSVDRAAGNGGTNGFALKLNSTGSALIYATYIGGSWGADQVLAVSVDGSGNAYLAGSAMSTDFPSTQGAFQTTDVTPGEPYSFAAKLDPSGSALVYSTYLMGNGTGSMFSGPVGQANGIAVDGSGNAYVVGGTGDTDFPVTTGAFQTSYSTDPTDLALFRFTGYIVKLNPSGSHEVYASYLGGGYMSQAKAVAVDLSGNAYVTGWTTGGDITTPGSFEPNAAGNNAYVVKVNPSGSALSYATYLGGTCISGGDYGDVGSGIAIDNSGDAYIAGQTCSVDFPVTTNAPQNALLAGNSTYSAFLSELNPAGSELIFSSYLGGSYGGDWALGVGVDGALNAYIAGMTHSFSFPTTAGAFQTQNHANQQGAGFVAKFSIPQGGTLLNHDFSLSLSPTSASISRGESATAILTVVPSNGFYEMISFSCSGLPTWAQCGISPASVTLGSSSATINVSIATELTSSASSRHRSPFWILPSLAALLCLFGRGKLKKISTGLALCILFVTTGSSGCGSSGNGGSGGSSFTVTIVGTASSVQHSSTFTVTAN